MPPAVPSSLRGGSRRWIEAARRLLSKPPPRHEPRLLSELAPEFAAELVAFLSARGELNLARSITTLPVVELCRCSDPRCASFYTIPRFAANWRWPQGGSTLDLDASAGTIRVDTAGGQIVSVEVLDRPQLATTLQATGGIESGLAGDNRLHRKG